jgi:hypothetical protein
MTEEFGIDAISPSTVFISGKAVTEDEALTAVAVALEDLKRSDNIDSIDVAEDTLLGLQRISGKALASLLYGKKEWWKDSKQDDVSKCTFEDYESSRHGLKSTVIDRYVVVWEKMSLLPEQFQLRPIRDLIPVAKALEQGYEIGKEVWKSLIKATSNAEIVDIIRKVKGKSARKSSRQLKMERDGTIKVWIGTQGKFVGYLDIKSEDEDVMAAVARILGNSGIVKR